MASCRNGLAMNHETRQKEKHMKIWRWMLAMVLGMVLSIGLIACGDDDEEGSERTCEDAVATLTSDTCVEGGTASGAFLQECVLACDPPGNELCVNDCVLAFWAFLPAPCAEAVGFIIHEAPPSPCKDCYGQCRDAALNCLLSFAVPVEDCAADSKDCYEGCL